MAVNMCGPKVRYYTIWASGHAQTRTMTRALSFFCRLHPSRAGTVRTRQKHGTHHDRPRIKAGRSASLLVVHNTCKPSLQAKEQSWSERVAELEAELAAMRASAADANDTVAAAAVGAASDAGARAELEQRLLDADAALERLSARLDEQVGSVRAEEALVFAWCNGRQIGFD